MIFHLYNILLTLLLVIVSPYFLLRGLFNKRFREELIQRLGFFPGLPFRRPIWVHAASVGEVFCAIPLLQRIKREFPSCHVVITTVTRTGHERAKTIPEADRVLFFPIDHPLVIRNTLRRIDPGLFMIAETEIWPNLLRSCGRREMPVLLFNGRISEKSFRRYMALRFFFRECLKQITRFLMQTEGDRVRMVRMGAPFDRTRVTGNIKFDQPSPALNPEAVAEFAKLIGHRKEEKIIVAGSTRPGEEEILLRCFKDLRKVEPHLLLILAPRHLHRIEEVERILGKESISWRRKTSIGATGGAAGGTAGGMAGGMAGENRPEVILLDTMGELMSFYGMGVLCFIGGSLVPVGGHNPIEPLIFRKCVLFGPYMFHFAEISRDLLEAGGAIQVSGPEDLALQLRRLLSDEGKRDEVGEKGYQFLQRHRGAAERMFEEIKPFLKEIADCRL